MVGNVPIGGDAPVAVQSMTTSDTRDIEKTIFQIAALVTLLILKSLQVLALSGDVAVRWVTMIYFAQIAESVVQVSLLLCVMSGIEYFLIHWDVLKRG